MCCLLGSAGKENLLRVRGNNAVEGKLADVLAAQLEQEAGAIAAISIDSVNELHLRSAIEMCRIGDVLDDRFNLAESVCLSHDRNVAQSSARSVGVRRVDIGCRAAIAERVGLQLLVQQRLLRRGR